MLIRRLIQVWKQNEPQVFRNKSTREKVNNSAETITRDNGNERVNDNAQRSRNGAPLTKDTDLNVGTSEVSRNTKERWMV